MSEKRKPVSKKTRFEVFKRDGFICQYCGAKAPDVELEVDHIQPVAGGGDNSILNLVTACVDCNRGKSDRKLSDESVLAKQRASIVELNKRRNQIEMMAQWAQDLQDLKESEIDVVVEMIQEMEDITVLETGRKNLKNWINRFGLEIIIEATYDSMTQYDDKDYAFNMIPKIAFYKANPERRIPQEAFYARGILRNRLSKEFDEQHALRLILTAANKASYEDINRHIETLDTWREFKTTMEALARGGR